MSRLFQMAKKFLTKQTEASESLVARERQLKERIQELEGSKAEILKSYDPSKPFSGEELQKVETDIQAIKHELEALTAFKSKPKDNTDDALDQIKKIKEEVDQKTQRLKEDAGMVLEEIEAAKQKFLEAQKKYADIKANHAAVSAEAKELAGNISRDFRARISQLQTQQEQLAFTIYQESSGDRLGGSNSNQEHIEQLQGQLDDVRRELVRLQGANELNIRNSVADLKSFRDDFGKAVYYIHDQEQVNASEKGQIQ